MRALFLKDLWNLFFPDLCCGCHKQLTRNETLLCVHCRHDLPFAGLSNLKENSLERAFYGRLPITSATALFTFHKKGKIQQLIHLLKYQNRQDIGVFMGTLLSRELLESDRFQDIDLVLPVPLHPKQFKKRGYNQLTLFGKEMAKNLKITLKDRVDEAHIIAKNIYSENKNKKSEQEIQKMIIDALSQIRFFDGRGYYFINSNKGRYII